MATIQPPMQRLPMARQSAQDRGFKMPLILAAVLFYVLLIPEQANFRITGLLMSPYRLYLVLGFIAVIGASREKLRMAWPDIYVILACVWITIASFVVTGSVTDTLSQAGAHATDIAVAYFFMRVAIRSTRDLRLFLVLIAPGVAFSGLIVFLESISGRLILQPLFSAVTGTPIRGGLEVRLGLTRGVGSFAHPILAGITLASFLTMYWMSGIRGWPRMVGIAGAIAGFFTMSSAALLGLVVGTALMIYDWLTLRIRNLTWRLFMFGTFIVYVTVELTSNSGFFNLLVRFASLNTVSAYNRVLIWKYGSQSVIKHPLFGIGYNDWERPSWMNWSTSFSVDNFWLLVSMRFGLPASVLLMMGTAITAFVLAKRATTMPPADARFVRGVVIALVVFALGAVSVSLWLNALVWFFMLLGIAASLGIQSSNERGPVRRIYVRPGPPPVRP